MMPGGLSEIKPATPEIQHLADQAPVLSRKQLCEQHLCPAVQQLLEKYILRSGRFTKYRKNLESEMQMYRFADGFLKRTDLNFGILLVLVRPQLESRTNSAYTVFKAVIYRIQVVAGTNYFIKVQDGEDDYVHLRVFQPLPQENEGPSLAAFQTGKTRDDPLTYF